MKYHLIGKNVPVCDAKEKAAGRARYVSDMSFPGILYIEMVFSTKPHALIKSIDTKAAEAVPGVIRVFHCFNTPERTFNRFRTVYGQPVYEQERIFADHIRFAGDRVAAVAATSREAARKAAGRISVTYQDLPFSLNIQETSDGRIDDIFPDGAVYETPAVDIGDVDGLKSADAVQVTTHTELARICHVTMETHGCIANYEMDSGQLTIYTPCQSVFSVRTVVADLLELPYHRVRVVKTTMGGSFGCKQEWITEPVAAYIAKELGRPVQLIYSRPAEQVSAVSRCPLTGDVTGYYTADGVLKGIVADASLDAGAYVGNTYDYAMAMGYKFTRSYRVPNLRFTSRAVITNTPVSGAFRGWTSPEAATMLEHNVNMAARRLGIDPVNIRLKNAYVEGDIDNRINVPLENTQITRALKEGRELFAWDQKKAENAAYTGRFLRGVGVACGSHVNGYFPRKQDFGTVDIAVNEDGTVQINMTLHDHGCGSITAFKMMAAEALGIDMASILLREADTAVTPFDMGCFSSRTVYVLGRTLIEACGKLKQAALQNVSEIHHIPLDKLTCCGGAVVCGTEEIASFKEIGRDSIFKLQRQLRASAHYVNTTNPGVHGVHFAQVEVDTCTGFVKVLDYLAVHDIGQAINRGMCVGQIQGAVMMGIGAALQEKLCLDRNGQPKSSLKDYHLMTSCDLPPIRVHLIEEPSKEGPYGAKSIGEVAYVAVAAAIVGAVNDALGSDLCAIPLDPESIVRYLSTKEEQ